MYPELDRERVARILCDGMRVSQTGLDYGTALKLAELELIIARSVIFVRCVYERDVDYPERHDLGCEGVLSIDGPDKANYCPQCGQPIEDIGKKKQFRAVDVTLNPKGITKFLQQHVTSLPNVTAVNRLSEEAFLVTLTDGRKLTLVLLDYAEARYRFAGLYFAEPYLYVIVSTINEPITHVLEENIYIRLADIISHDTEWLVEQVDIAAYPISGRIALEPVETQFDVMLARKNGWQYFEQQFSPALQRHITENPELVAKYLGTLKRISSTAHNYFTVPIGGAGRTDMRPINKLDLMNELFSGDAIADAKRYVRTHLEQGHISKILLHLETDPQRPRRAVVFLSTDRVRSSAWEAVMQLRNNHNYWKIIILTKYILLEILTQLEAIHLLQDTE